MQGTTSWRVQLPRGKSIISTENPSSEIEQLKFSKTFKNLNHVKNKKLEFNKWILISTESTVAMQKCGDLKEKNNFWRNFENVLQKYEIIAPPKTHYSVCILL